MNLATLKARAARAASESEACIILAEAIASAEKALHRTGHTPDEADEVITPLLSEYVDSRNDTEPA